MVKIMENPIKMDDLGGFPPIFGNTHFNTQAITAILKLTRRGWECTLTAMDGRGLVQKEERLPYMRTNTLLDIHIYGKFMIYKLHATVFSVQPHFLFSFAKV